MTKSVPQAEFQNQFDELLDEVVDRGDEVLVTRNGKPVAKLARFVTPFRARSLEELRGSGKVVGDIVAPLDEEWDAEK